MTSFYCTQGHGNPTNNRFCQECGQPLMIDNRYLIVRHLGQGGFGRTYLAENVSRNHEKCVLKEFAPQANNQEQLKKAEELFEREASVLSNLQHSQIPRLQERFRTNIGGKEYLFLVEDYIQGDTYWNLLSARKQQGVQFTEAEVIELMRQILPVLSYIHSQIPQVIHRDITPDNLMLRQSDRLPVLIDFGGVKQLQSGLVFLPMQLGARPTCLGKQGYAPEEQLRQGKVSPSSDLYSLAVTVLVLMTGEEPQNLYNSQLGMWRWGEKINLSLQLESVLKRMLAYKPNERYQSSAEVIQALGVVTSQPSSHRPVSQLHTKVVAPANKFYPPPHPPTPNVNPVKPHNNAQNNVPRIILPSPPKIQIPNWLRKFGIKAVGPVVVILIGVSAFSAISSFLHSKPPNQDTKQPNSSSISQESTRVEKILSRRKELGISLKVFNAKVNQKFYAKHPELQQRPLKSGKEDAALREEWYEIAEELLDKLEQEK